MAGTYHFMPPELIENDQMYISGQKADIWSLGVTFYSITFLELPFYDQDLEILFDQIRNKKYI